MLVIGQCDRTVGRLCLCKWTECIMSMRCCLAFCQVNCRFSLNNRFLVSFSKFCHSFDFSVTALHVMSCPVIIYSKLTNWTPTSQLSNFVNHSYSYRLNWTPFSPITIVYKTPFVFHLSIFFEKEEVLIKITNLLLQKDLKITWGYKRL